MNSIGSNKVLSGIIAGLLLLTFGCTSDKQFNTKLKKALKDNPDILVQAINAHPAEFMGALQKAAKASQAVMAKQREQEEKKKLEERYKNPLKPEIRKDEALRNGGMDAPITLVEYSDYECPFCARAYKTVMDFLKKYGTKVKFIYKHLPLSFHQNAMLASQYYEALRLQKNDFAFKFHDELYENQSKLKLGEKYFKKVAKKMGADMDKLAKDVNSDVVKNRIAEDQKEAAKFGMQGTPGFLLNGIPIRGAYPLSYFNEIIEELKKRGILKL
ncbi:MAG: thioredoxin domain-containing protein [Bacteriovoracaceae bacterium]|nr:thioredoxin domain-containing protein [Bacteriovoracaceae bacterium]